MNWGTKEFRWPASVHPVKSLSLIAAVMNNKGRAAGRSGLGAVMGSKKLKAVAVKASDKKVPVLDEAKAKEMRKRHLKGLKGEMLAKWGTPAIFTWCAESDDAPTKNWAGVATIDLPDYKNLGGDPVLEKQERKYGCWRCPIACGGHMKEGTGDYTYEEGAHKPEYETLAMFGSNMLNANLASIIKANDICNRYGVDTISAGAAVAFSVECYENGILTAKETDGLEMSWGNHKTIIAMLEKLARREGFGDILADGVKEGGRDGRQGFGAIRHPYPGPGAAGPRSQSRTAMGHRLCARRHAGAPLPGRRGAHMPRRASRI